MKTLLTKRNVDPPCERPIPPCVHVWKEQIMDLSQTTFCRQTNHNLSPLSGGNDSYKTTTRMNALHQRVYSDLLALTMEYPGEFIAMDKTVGSCSYRIFTYRRVPRYQKWWHNESALECRGITFERMDGEPIRLASWPFEKFFNWNENPMTRNMDFTNLRGSARQRGWLLGVVHDASHNQQQQQRTRTTTASQNEKFSSVRLGDSHQRPDSVASLCGAVRLCLFVDAAWVHGDYGIHITQPSDCCPLHDQQIDCTRHSIQRGWYLRGYSQEQRRLFSVPRNATIFGKKYSHGAGFDAT